MIWRKKKTPNSCLNCSLEGSFLQKECFLSLRHSSYLLVAVSDKQKLWLFYDCLGRQLVGKAGGFPTCQFLMGARVSLTLKGQCPGVVTVSRESGCICENQLPFKTGLLRKGVTRKKERSSSQVWSEELF